MSPQQLLLTLVAVGLLFAPDLLKLASQPPVDADRGLSAGGRAHVAFCTSCSYRGAFVQVQALLQQSFPGMEVAGTNYPPPLWRAAAAKAVGGAQVGGFVMVAMGERVFEGLGYARPPDWYAANVAQNKLGAGIGVWFAGNMLSNALVSTGAFEVYHDGQLVYSKLALGRMPTAGDILDGVRQAQAARAGAAAAASAGAAASQQARREPEPPPADEL